MSKTVLEKLLADCETAYRSKYPIIFIQTEELEMVRRVAASNRLVVRLKKRIGKDQADRWYTPCSEEELPCVRCNLKPELQECANVGVSEKIPLMGIPAAQQMPQMAILHISETFPNQNLPNIMAFVDRYLASGDDNGALRSSLYLLYGNHAKLPAEIRTYCAIIDIALPDLHELCALVQQKTALSGLPEMPRQIVYDIAYQMLGFTVVQAEHILETILSMPDDEGVNAIYNGSRVSRLISERKQQFLKQENLLELKSVAGGDAEIGGMDQFKVWFNAQAPCIINAGRMEMETGVSAPRGVLMCGVPGCGKSLAARAVARRLEKPLLQMDIGNLMGSLVGDSERNMDHALKLAEAMSPCVLWIDELEKGFSEAGNTGSAGDSGVFRRMFGKLLTWMQETRKPCFIFATANDITGLPKEFFRSGRFDELFAVYMPMHRECKEILKNQMQSLCARANRELFTDECLSERNLEDITSRFIYEEGQTRRQRFVTGADIEKLVNIAMRLIWTESGQTGRISDTKWNIAVLQALKSTTVYGDGPDNLDAIAMCYIRLLRSCFRPSAAESLFTAEDYTVGAADGALTAGFREKPDSELKKLHPYDRALYETLRERAKYLAPRFELNARERLVR